MELTQQDNGDDGGGHGRDGDDDDHGHGHDRVCVRVCHVDDDDDDRDYEHILDDIDGCEHVNDRGYDHGLCIVPEMADLACRHWLDTLPVGSPIIIQLGYKIALYQSIRCTYFMMLMTRFFRMGRVATGT